MSVYLRIEGDGITIYEDVTNKNDLLQFISNSIQGLEKSRSEAHEIFNDSLNVRAELEIFYEDKMIKLRLH